MILVSGRLGMNGGRYSPMVFNKLNGRLEVFGLVQNSSLFFRDMVPQYILHDINSAEYSC